MSLNDQLRSAIRSSDQSLYAIAKGTNVHYGVIYRFARGQRDIYLETASKLAAYLGLELMKKKKAK
jgi:hypothetical protein